MLTLSYGWIVTYCILAYYMLDFATYFPSSRFQILSLRPSLTVVYIVTSSRVLKHPAYAPSWLSPSHHNATTAPPSFTSTPIKRHIRIHAHHLLSVLFHLLLHPVLPVNIRLRQRRGLAQRSSSKLLCLVALPCVQASLSLLL